MQFCRQAFSLLFAIAVLVGCDSAPPPDPATSGTPAVVKNEDGVEDYPPNDRGKPFLDELAHAAQTSDRVIVVEHSFRFDTMTGNGDDGALPEYIYRTVRLSPDQRERFVKLLQATEPSLSMYASACIFEPHHRVEFYQSTGRVNTLEVCLQCSQQEWSGEHKGEPTAFYAAFASFVRSLEMRSDADWRALRLKAKPRT